jgi:ERCC4-related helicase
MAMPSERESFQAYWERVGWQGIWTAMDSRVSRFYVPLLARAVRYDRMAGYFSSSALGLAAAGLGDFLASGGVMRLIVGAQLDEDDVDAIERGELLEEAVVRRLFSSNAFEDVTSDGAQFRRRVLGWMVREGHLQIKVGVPLDSGGRPLRPAQSSKYFHSKYGIFTDHAELPNRVAFIGSDNETFQGWVGNHETFAAFPSWLDQVWENSGVDLVSLFEAHWRHRPDDGWAVLDLHEAVRDKLIAWAHGEEPPVGLDPEDVEGETPLPKPGPSGATDQRLVDLAEAPRRDGGTYVGLVTAGVEPLPHQISLVRRVVDSWPRGYLLADEVGLGKTIEAGFVIRELLLTGKAETFLLLVPAAVLGQWQEELNEKLALRVNRYDDGVFYDPDGREVPFRGSPWSAFPIVLATSHLARRRDRREEILNAGPWDVVLLDEAHHARRRGKNPNGEMNEMLRLIDAMRRNNSFKTLLLATATPMQMYPHEAWDLVRELGTYGRWADSVELFVKYFEQLHLPFDERDWSLLSHMAQDAFLDEKAKSSPKVERRLSELGYARQVYVRDIATHGLSQSQARNFDSELRTATDVWLHENNPMRDRVFRNTRETLRRYREAGLLHDTIPDRRVDDRFVTMTDQERELYKRIRTYIKRSYNRFQEGTKQQQALGFIMTVYRRRLTSSFKAIELSLERRLDVLVNKRLAAELLDEDDREADPGLFDLNEGLAVEELEHEISELRSFIADLKALPPDESKMKELHKLLETAFRNGHRTVLIFTQYTDTMNHIVDQLSTQYGSTVMSYSGAGGRRRVASGEWVGVSKKETKNLFREGKDIRILVGTDSLSEGLNLQTCGRVINFDMPWNFMRVEQRIGRLDRIGGQRVVEATNLFYKDTIEEQVYRGIAESHGGFTWIVGPAQPVLANLEQRIRDVELGPEEFGEADDRATLWDGGVFNHPDTLLGGEPFGREAVTVASIIEDLRREIEQAQRQPVSLATFESVDADESVRDLSPAATLDSVREVLLAVPATRSQLVEHPEIDEAWLVHDERGEQVAVTFDRNVLATFSPNLRLLTYGEPLFDSILRRAGITHK